MAFILVPPDSRGSNCSTWGTSANRTRGLSPSRTKFRSRAGPGRSRATRTGKSLTLDDVQRDKLNAGGDRHAIVVDPVNRLLYEFFAIKKTDAGWTAAQASRFDLKTNALRPDGWTSRLHHHPWCNHHARR